MPRKTAETIQELKRAGGGALVCRPGQAANFAKLLEAEGATVVCTLGVDFREPMPHGVHVTRLTVTPPEEPTR
jgi:hypothetical protein